MSHRNLSFLAAATISAAVLLLVAALQIFNATRSHQSPWKGGGFGMFSTNDSPGERFLRVQVLDSATPSASQTISIEETRGRRAHRLRYLPSQEELELLADSFRMNLTEAELSEADTLRIELYRRRWNASDGTVTAEPLYSHEVRLP